MQSILDYCRVFRLRKSISITKEPVYEAGRQTLISIHKLMSKHASAAKKARQHMQLRSRDSVIGTPVKHGEIPLSHLPASCSSAIATTVLDSLGYNLDSRLSPSERADSSAYIALITERLNVALMHSWWADERNYDSVIRTEFASRLPVPLCFYMPWSMRRRMLSQVKSPKLLRTA